MPSEVGRPIYLDQVAIDFPDLTIVAGHIGYPWTTEMIAVADKHPNVYIDTSAYAAHRYPAELVDYLKGRGRHKVMFGTNYPMMTPARALARLDDLAFTALFAGNDTIAFGALRALHEAGLRVPQDVAVVGYDDIPLAAFASPPLTTVHSDPIGHGRQALQWLLAQLGRTPAADVEAVAAARLVVRASCGAR